VLQRDGGDYRLFSFYACGLTSDDGAVTGIVGSWRDAQTEIEEELELDRRARIDPLTSLHNRCQQVLWRRRCLPVSP